MPSMCKDLQGHHMRQTTRIRFLAEQAELQRFFLGQGFEVQAPPHVAVEETECCSNT